MPELCTTCGRGWKYPHAEWCDRVQAANAAATADLGTASARKSGRRSEWPYVPVVVWTDDTGRPHDRQLLGLAYATRAEATDAAAQHISALRSSLADKLSRPNYRALRAQYGVATDLATGCEQAEGGQPLLPGSVDLRGRHRCCGGYAECFDHCTVGLAIAAARWAIHRSEVLAP